MPRGGGAKNSRSSFDIKQSTQGSGSRDESGFVYVEVSGDYCDGQCHFIARSLTDQRPSSGTSFPYAGPVVLYAARCCYSNGIFML